MPSAMDQLNLLNNIHSTKATAQNDPLQRQEELKKACQDFESIFVNYMMKQMRQSVTKDGIVGTSQAEEMYTSMLDNEVAKNISKARGIGLAAIIYRQMSGQIDTGETKK